MKNYLFAPFKDDNDKIAEFNTMLKSLIHLVDAEHELHVIRVFVCRLESYHDSIIQDMHNNKAEIVDGLLEESNLLKAELVTANDGINDLNDVVKDLQAENVELNDKDGLYDEVKELQAENKKLQVENIKLNSECWCGCNDDLRAEYMEIIAENKRLKAELDKEKEFAIETSIKNDRLMSQVGSDSHNNSSTHTHTIKKEIAEYMHHNPDSMGARLFLIPCDEFNDGERDGTIYWEDGME